MKYQEKNRQTLRDAIRRLPDHKAPDQLWSQIEDRLDRELPVDINHDTLKQALSQLPLSQAPDQVWRKIEHLLDGGPSPRVWLRRALAVAAAVALIAVTWLVWPSDPASMDPIAESASSFSMPTEASLTAWQEAREAEEERVFTCLDSLDSPVVADSLVARYLQISSSLDSLALLLQQEDVHDATLGRFQRLESSRKQTLARIELETCRIAPE